MSSPEEWERLKLTVETRDGSYLFEDEEGRLAGWLDDLGNMTIYIRAEGDNHPFTRKGTPLMQFKSWTRIIYGYYQPTLITKLEESKPQIENTISVGHDPEIQDEWKAKGYRITETFSKSVIMSKMSATVPGAIGAVMEMLDGLESQNLAKDDINLEVSLKTKEEEALRVLDNPLATPAQKTDARIILGMSKEEAMKMEEAEDGDAGEAKPE